MNKATMRQILLITDGCSNQGISPVSAAAQAAQHGVTVNVVGVVQKGLSQQAEAEIEQIAQAGKGLSEIVNMSQLSHTVQMVTRQAMTQTIHHVVNQELREILGASSVEQVPPETRMQVVDKVEQIGEGCKLEIFLLIDTSASMKPKLKAVEQSVYDLGVSLQSRKGASRVSAGVFPSKNQIVEVKKGWTSDPSQISLLTRQLQMSGTTPTGPALLEALQQFQGLHLPFNQKQEGSPKHRESASTGLLKDYVF